MAVSHDQEDDFPSQSEAESGEEDRELHDSMNNNATLQNADGCE